MAAEVTGAVLCDARADRCRCRRTTGHNDPHKCPCGGSWRGVIDTDSFEVIELPSMTPVPGLDWEEDW